MKILPIARDDLAILEPLLRASYGEGEFSIADEIDYFPNPAPKDWFWASDQGLSVGFLRHFAADSEISVAELHAPDSFVAQALLEHFAAHHELPEGQQLRFDLSPAMSDLETIIREIGEVAEVVNIHHFEKRIAPMPELHSELQAVSNFHRVTQILGALKPYSADQLKHLHAQGQLFVIYEHQSPAAAAHIQSKTADTLEIVTLATDVNHRQQGHARALLRDLEQYAAQHSLSIEFQVRADNAPAIRLYERAGYRSDEGRSVRWLYTRWRKPYTATLETRP